MDLREGVYLLSGAIENVCAGLPEVIQGRGGGKSCERGIQGAGGERAVRANRGQRGRILQKRHFAMFCYYNFLLILVQSKHKNRYTLSPLGKGLQGQTPTLAPLSCTLGLICQF